MRILHLTRDFPPRHHGGISTAVGGLVRASAAAGCAVAVVSFDAWRPRGRTEEGPADERLEHGVPVLRVRSPAHLARIDGFAAARRPDVLHVHDAMLWEAAAGLRARLAMPAVLTVHVIQRQMNLLRGTAERTLGLVAEEAALAEADRIIAPSQAAAAVLAGHAPGVAARLRVVPHGIEPAPATRRPSAPPHLLSVGRFDDVKGTPELFAAMPRILARLPDASFTVAGGIPANRRAEARWLAQWQRTTDAALRARVHFAGWLAPDALARCYAAAGALVLPSRFETFGLAALEAMQQGVPVAASAAGALAELIVPGESGLLAPVGDVDALVEHAVALVRDPVLAERISRAARAAARRDYGWERVLPAQLSLYRELR